MAHVLSIFHLTDLHLFVDSNGERELLADQAVLDAWFKGMQLVRPQDHDHEAWLALRDQLPDLVAQESRRAPVVVAQTGDVEGLGGRGPGAGYDRFPGFKALHQLRDAVVAKTAGTSWIDLYGNHDAWTKAIVPTEEGIASIRAIDGLAGPWPDRIELPLTDLRVELVRINTIETIPWRGALARGRVTSHPPGASHTAAMVQLALAVDDSDAPLRIALSHHPVHRFKRKGKRTTGELRGREELGDAARELPIHLLLAGHMHDFDPPLGPDAAPRLGNQSPLTEQSGQLVAQSATKLKEDHAITIYRVYVEDRVISVGRVVLERRRTDGNFVGLGTPMQRDEELLFEGISR